MCAVFLTLWSAADFVRWDIDLVGVLIGEKPPPMLRGGI